MIRRSPLQPFWLPILLLTGCMALSPALSAQSRAQKEIDSLTALLPRMPADTNKVAALNKICFDYFTLDPDKGLLAGQQALLLAQRLAYRQGIAKAYNELGANYWAKKDYVRAQDVYFRALQINEHLRDSAQMGMNLGNLSYVYTAQFNYSKALEFLQQALAIQQALGRTSVVQGLLSNMAMLYESKKDYPSALKYYLRSLDLAIRQKDTHSIAHVSRNMGLLYLLEKDYPKTLLYGSKALALFRQLKDTVSIANELQYLGQAYLEKHNNDSCLRYLQESRRLYKTVDGVSAKGDMSRCLALLGSLYLGEANPKDSLSIALRPGPDRRRQLLQTAASWLQQSVAISQSVNDWEQLEFALQDLSEVQSLLGQHAAALTTYKKYSIAKDSLSNSTRESEMLRRDLEYEYAKKKDSLAYWRQLDSARLQAFEQKEKLDKLTLKQEVLYSILAFILILFLGGYLFYRSRLQQIKMRNQLVTTAFSAIRSQMNPHFIFNVLNTIQSYVYSNEKKNAVRYLGAFSDLIRRVLDNSNKELISLSEEIEFLQLYIDMEQERFGPRLQTAIAIDEALSPDEIMVPPLLIQPYVENAIKHGLMHRKTAGRLEIAIVGIKEAIRIVIDDNGVGREASKEINKSRAAYQPFATIANEQRLRLINELIGNKATVEIHDKKNADGSSAGTRVTIVIPIIVWSLAKKTI